ncbi:MAG: hypothetical protein QGG40_01720 [Myxococcota bacterium]|nr:hypothetical protein [Myxococcota bacterium]
MGRSRRSPGLILPLLGLAAVGLQTGCATLMGGVGLVSDPDYQVVATKGPKKTRTADAHESVLRLADLQSGSDWVLVDLEEHDRCNQTAVYVDKYRRMLVVVVTDDGSVPDIVSMPLYVVGTYGLGWGAMAIAANGATPLQAQVRTAAIMNGVMISDLVVTGIYGLREFKREKRSEEEVVDCSEWAPATGPVEASVTVNQRSLPVEYDAESHELRVPVAVLGAVMLEHTDISQLEPITAQLSIERGDQSQGVLPANLVDTVSIDSSSLKQHSIPWRCEALAQPFGAEILDTHPPAHVGALFDELEPTCGEAVEQAKSGLCRRSKAAALQTEPTLVDPKLDQALSFGDIYTFLEHCDHGELWENKLDRWLSHTYEQVDDGAYAPNFETGKSQLDELRVSLPQYKPMFGEDWVSGHGTRLDEAIDTVVLAEKSRLETVSEDAPTAANIASMLTFSDKQLSGDYPNQHEQVQETGRELVSELLSVDGASLGMGESSYSPDADLEKLDAKVQTELDRVRAAGAQWTEHLGEDFVAGLNTKAEKDLASLRKKRVRELQAEKVRIAAEERAERARVAAEERAAARDRANRSARQRQRARMCYYSDGSSSCDCNGGYNSVGYWNCSITNERCSDYEFNHAATYGNCD